MRVKLTNTNVKEGKKEIELIFVPRKDEIIIATVDGKEIASLSICMMNKDVEYADKDGTKKWKKINSNNYWLQFNPIESQSSKDLADVYINDAEEEVE